MSETNDETQYGELPIVTEGEDYGGRMIVDESHEDETNGGIGEDPTVVST